MKKHFFLLIMISILGISQSFSQTSKVIGITSKYQKQDTINIQGDTLYDLLVTVHLVDTLNISKVIVQLGNSYGGSNVLNGEFNWYNDSFSTPSNIVFDRKFGMISFTVKNVVPSVLFYKANTENFQSVRGTPYIRQH